MNLGELYIIVGADTSAIDNLKSAFDSAARAAEDAGSRISRALSSSGDSGGNASASVKDLERALGEAARQAEVFGAIVERALDTAIDLAGKAASAVAGFVQDSVGQFSSYQQNIDTLRRTFGEGNADELMQWMEESSSAFGISINQMMDRANELGVIIQKDAAQAREAAATEGQLSTEDQIKEIDKRLESFKAGLSGQEAALSESQANELSSLKDHYAELNDQLKEQLDSELDAVKQNNNRIYDERKKALDQQLEDLRDTLDDEYDALKDSLDDQVEAQRKANEEALRSRQKALDEEERAYQKATDAHVKQINREYTERLKLIDEQKYNELKALQDQIDALDAQQEAEDRAAKDRQDAQKVAELRYKAENAKFLEDRQKAQAQLAELLLEIDERKDKETRSDQKKALQDQMEDVKKHYSDLKEEAEDTHATELAEYKTSRSEGLTALKEANDEEIRLLKEAQAQQIAGMKEGNEQALKDRKRKNEQAIKSQQEANATELANLKDAMEAQEKSISSSNSRRLKEQQAYQSQHLRSLKSSQASELRALKAHNKQLLSEQQRAANERKKALESASEQQGYVEVNDEDKAESAATFKKLVKAAADVAAARNMTVDQVLGTVASTAYGRYATFDNLGLGYANKSGIEQMVANMGEKLGQDLDFENFNDLVTALDSVVDESGYAGKATEEAADTISGSFNAMQASWSNFKLALASDDLDEGVFLEKLLGSSNDPGSVSAFIDNLMPVIQEVITAVTGILEEYGPQIAATFEPIVRQVIGMVTGLITEYGPSIVGSIKSVIADAIPDEFEGKVSAIVTTIEAAAATIGALAVAGGIVDLINLFERFSTHVLPPIATFVSTTLIPAFQNFAASAAITGAGLASGVITPLDLLSVALEAIGGPITLVVAAIAGMVANSESLRDVLGTLANAVGTVLKGAFDAIKPVLDLIAGLWDRLNKALGFLGDKVAEVVAPALKGLGDTLGPVFQDTVDKVSHIFEKLKNTVLNIADAMGRVLGPAIDVLAGVLKPIFQTVATFAGGALATIIDFFVNGVILGPIDLLSTALDTLSGIVLTVFDAIGNFLTDVSNNVKVFSDAVDKGLDVVIGVFGTLLDTIKTAIDDPITALEDVGKAIIDGLKNGIDSAWEGVKDFFGGVLDWIVDNKGPIDKDRVALVPAGKAIMNGLKDGASGNAWDDVKNFFGGIEGKVGGFFNDAGAWLTTEGSSVIDGLKGGVDTAWNRVTDFFGGVSGSVAGYFVGANGWLTSDGTDILNGLNSGLSTGWSAVSTFVGDIPGAVTSVFDDAWDWLTTAGSNIMTGLQNGLTGAWGGIKDFVGGIGPWIQEHKGPERYDKQLLVKAGGNIMDGLLGGLSKSFEDDVMPYVEGMGSLMEGGFGAELGAHAFDSLVQAAEGAATRISEAFERMGDQIAQSLSKATATVDGKGSAKPLSKASIGSPKAFGHARESDEAVRVREHDAAIQAKLRELAVSAVAEKGAGDQTVIMELDGVQFAKAVFSAGAKESKRVGTKLVGGYA